VIVLFEKITSNWIFFSILSSSFSSLKFNLHSFDFFLFEMIYKFYLFLAISSSFFFLLFLCLVLIHFFQYFFSILPFKIKLVWELGFLLEPKSKISLVIILQDYPRLENSPEFGLVFYIIKLGLSLYIYIYIYIKSNRFNYPSLKFLLFI